MNVVFLLLGRSEQGISEEEKSVLVRELGLKNNPTFIEYDPQNPQDHHAHMQKWRARCDHENYRGSALQVHVLLPETESFQPLGESLPLIMHKRILRESGEFVLSQFPWEEALTC